jgi:hypothetical protein
MSRHARPRSGGRFPNHDVVPGASSTDKPGQDAGPGAPVCDFCNAPASAFAYPVAAIIVHTDDEEISIPATQWRACLDCHLLIEQGNWAALNEHAGYPPGYRPTLVTAFRSHRRGSAVRVPAKAR